MPKIDTKDRRILNEIDKEPNISTSRVAKRVGLSRQVVEYRLSKLLSQDTIHSFYTVVDLGKLGYSYYRALIRLRNVTDKDHREFAKKLFNEYPAFWVAYVSGSFDLIVGMFAKNSAEFKGMIADVLKNNKNIIQSYETLFATEANIYSYGYFSKNHKKDRFCLYRAQPTIELEDVDKKILAMMKKNSRISFQEMASKVNVSRNTVKNRIKRMEKEKIIVGYKPFMNFDHFNMQSYKLFIKYDNTKIDQEEKLINYLSNLPGILATLRIMGKWNLDIELHEPSIKELQRFIIDLRNKFEIIEDYEIIHIIEDYGFDFFPDKLN